MKFILCPDSFKDSLSASEVCQILSAGIHHFYPAAQIVSLPISDGGEGFCTTLTGYKNGRLVPLILHNAVMEPVNANYGLIDDDQTAVIEAAEACGLQQLSAEKRNPLLTTSYGVGELIIGALNKKVTKLIIGLGGSATNDGGCGMLYALGAKFYDEKQHELIPCGANLAQITQINLAGLDPRLKICEIIIASDVTNRLLGENGATYTFARQKGATTEMLINLEQGMENYVQCCLNNLAVDLMTIRGGGAAGGLGAAFAGILGAKICSGIELMLKQTDFERHLVDANYIISGEGKVDRQTIDGKVIAGLAPLCKKHSIPLLVFTGSAQLPLDKLYTAGVSAIIPITPGVCDLATALKNSRQNLQFALNNVLRLLNQSN